MRTNIISEWLDSIKRELKIPMFSKYPTMFPAVLMYRLEKSTKCWAGKLNRIYQLLTEFELTMISQKTNESDVLEHLEKKGE